MNPEVSRRLIFLLVGCTIMVFSGPMMTSWLTQFYDAPPSAVRGDVSAWSAWSGFLPTEPDTRSDDAAKAGDSPPAAQTDPVAPNPVSVYEFRGPFDITNATVGHERIVDAVDARDAVLGHGTPGSPKFRSVSAYDATQMRPEQRVVGVEINEQARAYPIVLLNRHGVVNDTLGGMPIAVTWCGPSALARVFDRSVQGESLSFGASGRLLDCNSLLYDHQTMSLWSQFLGKAISGTFVDAPLVAYPALQTTWDNWLKEHPGTTVLAAKTGAASRYDANPFVSRRFNDRTSPDLPYPVSRYRRRANSLHPKAMILSVTINGVSKAYPFSELSKSPRSFRDVVGGEKIVIRFDRSTQTARATDIIDFPIEAPVSFWYSWSNFHPDGLVYDAEYPLGRGGSASP